MIQRTGMRRISAILGSALFFVLAPCTVAGLVPWWISRWQMAPPFFAWSFLRIIGVALILAGLPVLLDSFARFAIQGLGTPAPVFPTQAFGSQRMVSLCPQSDVRCRSVHHCWPSFAFRKHPSAGIRRRSLASGSLLRPGVRRTDHARNIRRRVPAVLRECSALDSASHTVALAHSEPRPPGSASTISQRSLAVAARFWC